MGEQLLTLSRVDGDQLYGEFDFWSPSSIGDWGAAEDDVGDLDDDPDAQPVEYVIKVWQLVEEHHRTVAPKANS